MSKVSQTDEKQIAKDILKEFFGRECLLENSECDRLAEYLADNYSIIDKLSVVELLTNDDRILKEYLKVSDVTLLKIDKKLILAKPLKRLSDLTVTEASSLLRNMCRDSLDFMVSIVDGKYLAEIETVEQLQKSLNQKSRLLDNVAKRFVRKLVRFKAFGVPPDYFVSVESNRSSVSCTFFFYLW